MASASTSHEISLRPGHGAIKAQGVRNVYASADDNALAESYAGDRPADRWRSTKGQGCSGPSCNGTALRLVCRSKSWPNEPASAAVASPILSEARDARRTQPPCGVWPMRFA